MSCSLDPLENPFSLRVQGRESGERNYCSVKLVNPILVAPCQKVRVDIEPLTDQAVRIELKTGDYTRPEEFVRRQVHRLLAGRRQTADIEVPRALELNEVTFAMEGPQQENGIQSGTFLVHCITICGEP